MRFVAKHSTLSRPVLTSLLCFCALTLLPWYSHGADGSLEALLQRLSAQGQLQIAGATIYDISVTQEFYQRAGLVAAWTSPQRVEELAEAINQAYREGMNGRDYHQAQIEGLRDGSLSLDTASRDLLLTDSLVRLIYHYALGKIDPQKYSASWNFDRELPQVDPVVWLGEVIANGGINAGLDVLKPRNPMYKYMVLALAEYRLIEANGGWQPIADGPTLRQGDTGPRVEQLRRRLLAEGDEAVGGAPEPARFDAALAQSVLRFQQRYRLDTDAAVGRQTLAAMNVSTAQRIGQIRVNLERARSLQDIPPTAVVVDIAGFEVSLYRDGHRMFHGRAQVGRPYRSTPVFSDSITYIEFNPTWTVPPTILRKDTLPAIKRDPDYLRTKNMQVLTLSGEEVDPATVAWDRYPREGFPYMIRQRPGPDNALGRLKIMFPNEHMVYLHDTPSRNLFERSERTFSSGCIRVENIERLAELLLSDKEQWDSAAIEATIARRQTRRISLRTPVPIYLVYWTVQVSPEGEVQFKRDPYSRDAQILDVLEQPLVPDGKRVEAKPRAS